LDQKNDNYINFVFRTQKFQNIQDTPVGVFFIKSILSKNIKTLIMHYNNENLIEDFLTSLKHVLLDLQLFDCCIPKSDKIIKINVPKTIYKEGKYAASKNTIAESILNEPESFPPLDVKCIEQESINFLARSCPLEREFLTTLVNTYIGTISTGPSDIGKITKKIYHVDIELLDKSNPLPLDLPYPTNDINKLACARIVQTWLAAVLLKAVNCEPMVRN